MKKAKHSLASIIFILFCVTVVNAQNDSVYIFNDFVKSELIGKYTSYFKDSTKTIVFNDIVNCDKFIKSTTSISNFGVDESVYWIKFKVKNNSSQENILLEIENSLLNDVTLYQIYDRDSILITSISKDLGFDSRENDNQYAQFTLKQKKGSISSYYLKIRSYTQIVIPIKLGTHDAVYKSKQNTDILSAVYFGVMLVMFLYNIFLYFSIKDRSYLYYVLYILSVALVQLGVTGIGFKYLWPLSPDFEKSSVYLFSALTAFTSIGFFQRFLNSKSHSPRANKIFIVFIISYLFTLYQAFWGNKWIAYNLLNINALPLALFMIGLAAYIWRKYKYRPAIFFLIAWGVFLCSIIVFVLKDVGVFPYNLLTVSSLQIGSAIETVLLSIALADRINILRIEKEQSQREKFLALQENERIVREQNKILEAKVEERTAELKESNEHLEQAMVELQEKESQLVESEKMASLGQLTAGIAHEINNPINFVTSNVNPLKRDLAVLTDMIEQMEELSISDADKEEKLKKIKSIKTEADYDYLKTEIEHLLKGIHEGATRTADIVKGLRVFSRLDEDDLKRADVNEGLKSTIIIINHLLNNVIEVETHFANLPMIECYPGKLNQVFLNIMSNAIYAIHQHWKSAKGGKLSIETMNGVNNIVIKIKDNGIGMDESVKRKLFDPFFTTKDVGEGTGLGLSITYNTIKKHEGIIEVISEPGEGAEFIITLPILQN